jgi:hypothetical protein
MSDRREVIARSISRFLNHQQSGGVAAKSKSSAAWLSHAAHQGAKPKEFYIECGNIAQSQV